MNRLIATIKEMLENRKIKKDFKASIFGGVKVVIKGEDLDKIYTDRVYDSISRSGPFEVREIRDDVYNWCLKAKGIIRVPEEYRIQFISESFYFSRHKDAEEFKKTFNVACS